MGFLDRLKASQSSTNSSWSILEDRTELEKVDELSKDKPVILFKHSTSCGISASAKHRLEVDWDSIEGDFEFYYLDLLNHRAISNEISQRYEVRHESPQILIIKNGIATYHASHHGIQASAIQDALTKVA